MGYSSKTCPQVLSIIKSNATNQKIPFKICFYMILILLFKFSLKVLTVLNHFLPLTPPSPLSHFQLHPTHSLTILPPPTPLSSPIISHLTPHLHPLPFPLHPPLAAKNAHPGPTRRTKKKEQKRERRTSDPPRRENPPPAKRKTSATREKEQWKEKRRRKTKNATRGRKKPRKNCKKEGIKP